MLAAPVWAGGAAERESTAPAGAAGTATEEASPQTQAAAPAPGGDTVVDATIGAGELERHVRYLASDALGGRGLGSEGIAAAEEYIAARLEQAGWRHFPDRDSYFTPFTVYEHGFDSESTTLGVRTSHGTIEEIARYETGLRPFWFSDTGSYEGEAVFAGYGVSAPEDGYDDYEGLDVEDKVVFVLRHEPPATKPTPGAGEPGDDESEWSENARFNEKAEEAEEHGAVGIIVVTDPLYSTGPEDFRSLRDTSLSPDGPEGDFDGMPDGPEDMLAVHISQEAATSLTSEWGRSLRDVQESLNNGTRPAEMDLPVPNLSLSVRQRAEPAAISARNVVALHESANPDQPLILLGAHHDHLGSYSGSGDTIFNGADDNASGTALLLEIAERLSERSRPRPLNIAVATFSGEEEGLLGSRWLAEEGILRAGAVCHMVNLDMVGRNAESPVDVYGTDRYLREYVVGGTMEAAADWPPLEFHGRDLEGYSDYYPYYDAGVPFTFITTGLHEDYHRTSDEADTLDYAHMKRIADLVAHALITRYDELCGEGAISMTAPTP